MDFELPFALYPSKAITSRPGRLDVETKEITSLLLPRKGGLGTDALLIFGGQASDTGGPAGPVNSRSVLVVDPRKCFESSPNQNHPHSPNELTGGPTLSGRIYNEHNNQPGHEKKSFIFY